MKKTFKELAVLIILPLVLMSMSLGVIGTSHSTKMTHTSRIKKLRHESIYIQIPCKTDLCEKIKTLENTMVKLEENFNRDQSV